MTRGAWYTKIGRNDVDAGKPDEVLKVESDAARDQAIIDAGFLPGWIGEGGLRPEPIHEFEPSRWSWAEGRQLLLAASKSIDPRVAERRNIRMANPVEGKRTSLNNIHASYQMVAPGEFARAHRHTINAGRFILESTSAFTTLDGEKVIMEPNDIILTPNWVWHGLGNESTEDGAYWVDFLDDPLVSTLKTIFFEVRDEDYKSMPVNENSPDHIKWHDVDRFLTTAEPGPDQRYGRRVKLDTPSLPTMALYMERFDANSRTKPLKSTANHLFVCAEGAGCTIVDGDDFDWQRGDVVAVPSWNAYHHQASTAATLLEISDRPVMEAFDWYREFEF